MGAVDRALELLDVLSEHHEGLGVTKLSETLDEPVSSVHRLLRTLARHGAVAQDPTTRAYRLGPAPLAWARAYLSQDDLVECSRPILDELCRSLGESVFVTERIGDNAIVVATAERPSVLRFYMRLGQRMPYSAAASARAILAFRPRGEAEGILQAEATMPFNSYTKVTVPEAMSELERIRIAGYAVCDEEMEDGVTAIAVPLRGAREVRASLSVVAPSARLDRARWSSIVDALQSAAAAIAAASGEGDPISDSGPHEAERSRLMAPTAIGVTS